MDYWRLADTVAGFGGFAAAIAVCIGFIFTKKSLSHAADQINNQTEQLTSDKVSRANEEFHRASEQLHDSNELKAVAGLYTLESVSIANQGKPLYRRCIDVICAFIRVRSAEIHQYIESEDDYKHGNEDLTVAWNILTRRDGFAGEEEGDRPLKLYGAVAINTAMQDGGFCAVRFVKCHFEDVSFARSRLNYALFLDCTFKHVRSIDSDMRNVKFQEGNASKVRFIYGRRVPTLRTPKPVQIVKHEGSASSNVEYLRSSEDALVGSELIQEITVVGDQRFKWQIEHYINEGIEQSKHQAMGEDQTLESEDRLDLLDGTARDSTT